MIETVKDVDLTDIPEEALEELSDNEGEKEGAE